VKREHKSFIVKCTADIIVDIRITITFTETEMNNDNIFDKCTLF